jgi:hypothetical protein
MLSVGVKWMMEIPVDILGGGIIRGRFIDEKNSTSCAVGSRFGSGGFRGPNYVKER